MMPVYTTCQKVGLYYNIVPSIFKSFFFFFFETILERQQGYKAGLEYVHSPHTLILFEHYYNQGIIFKAKDLSNIINW